MTLIEHQSVGSPNLLTREDVVATVLSLVDGAWSRVRLVTGLQNLNEPGIAGLLYLELWQEKRRRKLFGPPFIVDEGASRSGSRVTIPDGWIDLKFIYSFAEEQSFFGVECKRVRAGDKTLIAEYVENGIMRFVTGRYSAGHDWAAMCGFVIDGRQKACAADLQAEMHAKRSKTQQLASWQRESGFGKRKNLFRSKHRQLPENNAISLLHLLLTCPSKYPTKSRRAPWTRAG